MEYIKKLSNVPSFSQDGFNGFSFSIDDKNMSINMIDSYKGHEKYCKNLVSTHIYYIISGSGRFKINGEIYNVEEKDIIEIPPNTEFIYAGKMKMLLIMNPPFNDNDNIEGKDNDLY